MSISLLVKELKQEPFDPILIYKPQGEVVDTYPSLEKNSFLLALQTEFQQELYRKYAGKILCIDATHGTNAYRFKLISCIVQDDYGKGTILRMINSSILYYVVEL